MTAKPTSLNEQKSTKSKTHKVDIVKNFDFKLYIRQVLKQVHPDTGISGVALATMDNLVKINIKKLTTGMIEILSRSGTKTVSAKHVESAVSLKVPGELAKHSKTEGTKAVNKYKIEAEEIAKKP